MTKAEEKRMEKAKALRYRKPAVKDLNLASIQEQLTEIEEACADVHWYCDSADGWDTLLNALDGDDEEAWEFKLAFSDLEGECERMREDMDRLEEWDYDDLVGDHFDIFFAGIGAASVGGGLWGFDEYEGDYFGLEPGWESEAAERVATEKLKRLTKEKLIGLMGQAFRIAVQFLALRSRYLGTMLTEIPKQSAAVNEFQLLKPDFKSFRRLCFQQTRRDNGKINEPTEIVIHHVACVWWLITQFFTSATVETEP